MRNRVKLEVFSKDTLLCGGNWLWAWQISWGLQTCIAERSKLPKVKTQTESHDRRPIV